MKRMRVLLLVASCRGGGASHVRDLALGVDSARFSVEVAMPEDGGNVGREDFDQSGIPFHRVDIAEGLSLRALHRIRHLIARVDILHVHGARAAFFGRLAGASLGTRRPRIVYTIHGLAAPHYRHPRSGLLLGVERGLACLTDRFIAVSRSEREALLAASIARPERVSVVWNGIDVARFGATAADRAAQRAAIGVPGDARLVTTVCRLYKPRDFETLLAAFQEVVRARPSAWLLIVGDGPYRAQIETRIHALGNTPNAKLAGFRNDIPQILYASDIFVLSTALWEGLPLTVLEAMASGLPVVASDVGGIGEAVLHQETGFLVPPRSPTHLREALLNLVDDDQKAEVMGRMGRKRVVEHFTLRRMAWETMAIYEGLLGHDQGAG